MQAVNTNPLPGTWYSSWGKKLQILNLQLRNHSMAFLRRYPDGITLGQQYTVGEKDTTLLGQQYDIREKNTRKAKTGDIVPHQA